MSNLIDRQAAIEALTENKEMINAVLDSLTLDYNTRRYQEQRRGQINEDIETIKELPSAQPERKWIPCSERLPEKPDNYPCCGIYRTYFLVTLKSGCVKSLGYEFDSDRWQITGSPVIAWMPLPEPYQAERREDG